MRHDTATLTTGFHDVVHKEAQNVLQRFPLLLDQDLRLMVHIFGLGGNRETFGSYVQGHTLCGNFGAAVAQDPANLDHALIRGLFVGQPCGEAKLSDMSCAAAAAEPVVCLRAEKKERNCWVLCKGSN